MVLIATKKVILASSFLSIYVDEMTTIDNYCWIFVHCYVVVDWKNKCPFCSHLNVWLKVELLST